MAVIAILVTVLVTGCALLGFRYQGGALNLLFAACVTLIGYGAVKRRRDPGSRIGAMMQAFGMFIALSALTTLGGVVLARSPVPYIDASLDRIDRMLVPGFDWPAMAHWLAHYPLALTLLSHAYVSLNWQPLVLFGALAIAGRSAETERFVTAWAIALLICIVPFRWLPAHGPYAYYEIPANAMPGLEVDLSWRFAAMIDAVRDGSFDTLGPDAMIGMISIPSFHACAATLLGWAFWQIRGLRWPFAALNVAMLVSAVPVGDHYLSDIVAGVLLAIVAIALSGRIAVRRERNWPAIRMAMPAIQ